MISENIKCFISNGDVVAIAIDTSVYHKYNYAFSHGVLNELCQLAHGDVRLIFPDIVYMEVLAHLQLQVDEAKHLIIKNLKKASRLNVVQGDIVSEIAAAISGNDEARKLLDGFIEKTRANIIDSSFYVDIAALIKLYFEGHPPFAGAAEKKYEFPDAIALIALETYAQKNGKYVIVVSRDKGWETYCTKSANLIYFCDLTVAMAQLNDQMQANELCSRLNRKFSEGMANDLIAEISEAIENVIGEVELEACSAYSYEEDFAEVTVDDISIYQNPIDSTCKLISVDDSRIVIELMVQVKVKVSARYSLSDYDTIDRVCIDVGKCSKDINDYIDASVLLHYSRASFENLEPNTIDAELLDRCISVGEIEPDWDYDY